MRVTSGSLEDLRGVHHNWLKSFLKENFHFYFIHQYFYKLVIHYTTSLYDFSYEYHVKPMVCKKIRMFLQKNIQPIVYTEAL